MFNRNTFTSQGFVSLFLPLGQWRVLGFLERWLAVFMKSYPCLVTRLCQNTYRLGNITLVILEKLKVMFTSLSKSSCQNFGGFLVGNQLCFLSVALLFATVMPFLAFFGRSTGCSLTSISTTSKWVSLGWSAFLPGRRNWPERTNAFSTFRMVRQTVASLRP